MAAVNVFVSIPKREVGQGGELEDDRFDSGAASTATDFIELRMMTNDGTNPTNLTRKDVLIALDAFERFIINDTSVLGFM